MSNFNIAGQVDFPPKHLHCFRDGWYNRVFRDPLTDVHPLKSLTQETLYFCEMNVEWGRNTAYFHRDGKHGFLFAKAFRRFYNLKLKCTLSNGLDITLDPELFGRRTFFEYKNLRYRWSGVNKLKRQDGVVIALFERDYFKLGRVGMLHVFEEGKDMLDIVIATLTILMVWMQQN